ncbi:MAG: transketolase [Alphaproteobacteria bacterium]|nr:transketolase [Alphaproteobacteria bacterium]
MANAIRALAMDAVEKAQSGHPGMPMGMADVATVLYSKFLKFNPQDPQWPDRDRFVLSAGHGSMLLYALNYLTGYEAVTLEQIKNFRQLGALTAGHPEVEHHAGIETTTGPLGQGISTAVGMALAERILNARFGDDLVDHYTYVIASDGDLQEGISHEACSLAGHLALRRLIVLYDDNGISIDGPTSLSFTDDTPKRFEAYGWDVQTVDGHDFDQIQAAIAKARQTSGPALICCKTHIGYGAPTKQDSASSHGSPLGTEEIKGTREKLAWPHAPFSIPEDILSWWRKVPSAPRPPETNGTPATPDSLYTKWQARLRKSDQRAEFEAALRGDVAKVIGPIIQDLKKSIAEKKPKDATRKCSGNVLEKLIPALPTLVGGSADLTGSNNTQIKGPAIVTKAGYNGQYIYYGVREHGMAAAMNGMALHGGVIPYGGTFLIFTDYCRPSIRLSALMNQRVVYVMTHDSIGLGEDGPTHQPVEHLASLRAMPNLLVFRPCDGIETAEAWELALNHKTSPSVLALTRQGLPTLAPGSAENKSAKGAYTLKESGGKPQVTLFASGSEVSLTHQAYETLVAEGYAVRLVSAPCLDLFWQQNEDYIQHFLRNDSLKIAVEAAGRESWDRILGHDGVFIGMKGFGASAPAEDLYRHFGITPDAIVDAVRDRLG